MGNINMTLVFANKRKRILKEQSKMDNPEKLEHRVLKTKKNKAKT
jgi:hypothetical protein